MKVAVPWLLAALLAIGCGSKTESSAGSGPEAARPTVTDPIGFCARARAVMMGRRKCFPEDASIKMGLDGISELEDGAPAEPEARRKVAAQCAVMLDGMMRAEQPHDCPLDVTAGERAELAAFLTGWYGERTAAPKTGDAAADAALVKLAADRDAACACKDLACARKAGTALDGYLDGMASDTPRAAREAAARMIGEVGRCKQQLTFGAPTK